MTLPRNDRSRPIDVNDDIQDRNIFSLYQHAKNLPAPDDSDGHREELALTVQDVVLALRDLGYAFSWGAGGSITLFENKDLFVFNQPCHPRDVAARLVAKVADDKQHSAGVFDIYELQALAASAMARLGDVAHAGDGWGPPDASDLPPPSSAGSDDTTRPYKVLTPPAPAFDVNAFAAQLLSAMKTQASSSTPDTTTPPPVPPIK